MPVLSTTTTVTAVFAASALLLRKRVSRKWVSLAQNKTDLSNKTILITGANTGLGFEAAKDFSRRNANVIIACRNMNKGNEAVSAISKSTGKDNVECIEVDLASLSSVRKFIDKIQSESKYSSIHTLILNAGVWIPDTDNDNDDGTPKITADGYEMHFGVNHLSQLLIATSLETQLTNSGDGRIVFVASSLMKSGKINLESEDFIREQRRAVGEKTGFAPLGYCDTKLMNVLTCKHLSTILPSTITTYSICPGFCRSSLGRHVSMSFFKKLLVGPIMLMIQRTPAQGAQNLIFAAVEDKDKLQSGMLYRDGKISEEHMSYADSLGEEVPRKLFELSNRLVQKE